MSCRYSKLSTIFIILVLGALKPLPAQNPESDKVHAVEASHEGKHSFKKMKEEVQRQYEGTPVKGSHKRAKRALHYLEDRLDKDGNVFNHVQANLEALQQLYIDTLPGLIQGDWHLLGPLNTLSGGNAREGMGRVNCIAVASATTWYVGTGGGGLWRTDVGGIYFGGGNYPWYPLTDSLPVLSISGIAVHPNDVDNVYILTGDGDNYSSDARPGDVPGIGILHSTDGGLTWETTALTWDRTDTEAGLKLAMYPGSPDTMFAACTDGLYRTTTAWQNRVKAIDTTCYDFEFKPGDPQIMYAACAGSLRQSTNGGITWSDSISNNLDYSSIDPNNLGRIAIGVSPDAPEILYVVIVRKDNGGLMSLQWSPDGGASFLEVLNNNFNILAREDPDEISKGQGNYDLAIWVDPSEASTLLVGGVDLWRGLAFGANWSIAADDQSGPPEYVHADIHAIEHNPYTGSILVGSDGGIYESTDGGYEWEKRSHGLGITQFYHLGLWAQPNFFWPYIGGGAQDNGTSISDPEDVGVFELISGGDGFRMFMGPGEDFPVFYTEIQNGKLLKHHVITTEITPEEAIDENDEYLGAWDTPYQPNPHNIHELVAGYRHLYYNGDGDVSWQELEVLSPGSAYSSSALIRELEWPGNDLNTLYFYIQDGDTRDLWHCNAFYLGVFADNLDNANCMVTPIDSTSALPNQGPTDIAVNPYDDKEIILTFPGYSTGNKVFLNQNMEAGAPWVNITFNIPNVPVHCAEFDIDGIYVGTDIGAFFLPNTDSVWVYFSKGLPTVPVTQLEVAHLIWGKTIWASTYGRGIWWSFPPAPERRTHWFVDSSAAGLNTGANWDDAFTDFQIALDTVLPGDSIWVAKGTYLPTSVFGFITTTDNVRILGGFNGTEDSVSQRDFVANPTILSGDIGVSGDSLDNAYHVMRFRGYNANVLLDGFHITEGYARGSGTSKDGAGIHYTTDDQTGKPLIKNCRIYNNSCTGFGAGMFIADYAQGDPDFRIVNCVFENNRSSNKGGGLYIDAISSTAPIDTGVAVVFLDTCSFIANRANSKAGAIGLEANRDSKIILVVESGTFDGNTLDYFQGTGAGIFGETNIGGGTIEFECRNTLFMNHSAGTNGIGGGGAVYFDGRAGHVESTYYNSTFDNNHAYSGGAIMSFSPLGGASTELYFEECNFTNNSSISAGGAVYINSRQVASAVSDFLNCNFINNTANQHGGAIIFNAEYAGNIAATFDSCAFSENSGISSGAIYFFTRRLNAANLGYSNLMISNSLFIENSTNASGGAIYINNSTTNIDATIQNTEFINNNAGGSGGVLSTRHVPSGDTTRVTTVFDQCTFTGNTASNLGGALSFEQTDVTMTGCTFSANSADFGGAIRSFATTTTDEYLYSISQCGFYSNFAEQNGGAIYHDFDDPCVNIANINSCNFDGNYTTSPTLGRGGAIYMTGKGRSIQTITNTDFTNNSATVDGGAMYVTNDHFTPVDTFFLVVDSCYFFNNDVGATGKTIEIFATGTNARIFSQWRNTDFYNDETNVMFRNRKSSGISHATFKDCHLYLIGGQEPLQDNTEALPIPFVIDDH